MNLLGRVSFFSLLAITLAFAITSASAADFHYFRAGNKSDAAVLATNGIAAQVLLFRHRLHRRLLPTAIEDGLARKVHAKDSVEWAVWRGKPVGLLCGARIFVR